MKKNEGVWALRKLNRYFWRYKWPIVLGIVFTTISNLFAIYPAMVIREALDILIENIQLLGSFNESDTKIELISFIIALSGLAALAIVLLSLLKGFFLFLVRQTIIVVSRFIEYDLKNDMYSRYQQLDYGFFKENSTGDLMNRISEDVSRVRMYIGPALMYGINLLVLFALVISTMVSINAYLTFWVLLPLPFLSLAVYLVNSTILRRSEKVQRKLSELSSLVQETFSGIRILKIFNRLSFFDSKMRNEADGYLEENMGLTKVNAVFFPLVLLLIGCSTLLVILVGGAEVSKGKISAGVIAEFIIYVNMLTWPVASLGWVTSIIQRAAASCVRINEFLEAKPELSNEGVVSAENIKGEWYAKNLSFTYPHTGIEALKSVSFSMNAGQTLGITGPTGSGKTTLAMLLMRFFDAKEGELKLDSIPLKEYDLSSYRSRTGFVSQDVFLFSDSISSNIAFGVQAELQTEERIEQAAKMANVHKEIKQFTNGYSTRLGERGITLSGGQKQRIAIARAILREPAILIFDDCLSAVDAETEEVILQNLLEVMKGKTSIIISHRVSALRHADQILVLQEGSVTEQGNHTSLLKKNGFYANLYQQQWQES
jgi:ATP-binding cassette, subfamily B, multidrug efflux pump